MFGERPVSAAAGMAENGDRRDDRRALIAVIAAATAMAVSLSLSLPLVSLSMAKRGFGGDIIGLMGALPALSFLITSPLVPGIANRVGAMRMLWAALLLSAFSIWSLAISDNIYFWFLLRLLIGLSMATLFQISETWINKIAREETRGRTIAFYVAATTFGFAFGPILINLIGAEGVHPFLISGAIVLSAGVAFIDVGHRLPSLDGRGTHSILSFVKAAPMISAAVVLVAFFDGSILTLLPVYGLRNGLAQEIAVLMTTAVLAGNILLQMPIGWLADRFNRGNLILGCGVIGVAGAILLPFAMSHPPFLWPMLIIWGGAVVGTYTLALVIMGQEFKGADLVTATAAIGVLWGFGSLTGPVLAGTAMEIVKPHGMPAVFATACLVFVGIALFRRRQA
ncbi:MAG: MFS transporter [Alphaproteobacteria bacterium]|nr:MAG: MFS transporter [Alphaproteobacteria bacterium]